MSYLKQNSYGSTNIKLMFKIAIAAAIVTVGLAILYVQNIIMVQAPLRKSLTNGPASQQENVSSQENKQIEQENKQGHKNKQENIKIKEKTQNQENKPSQEEKQIQKNKQMQKNKEKIKQSQKNKATQHKQSQKNKQKNEHNLENKTRQDRPHILLIVADDLGYNDIGYHRSIVKTPFLDKLARSGVRLENYYVQHVCTPTRGQLLSGRYEIHTGLHSILRAPVPLGLPLDSPTVADKIKEAGYSTHLVGKWHVGFHKKDYLPTRRGFDSYFGTLTGHSDHYTYRYGLHSSHGPMSGAALYENDHPANMTRYQGKYSTLLYTDKAKEIIRRHNPEKPLFLFLSYQAPHTPLQVPPAYMQPYLKYSNIKRKKLAGMVSCMDEQIEQVVNTMKQKGLWDNTILIFTSDNGGEKNHGSSNWPLKGNKGQVWEGGIRAVGFVHSHLLDNSTAGTVSNELMHVTDWFPTLVNIAGGNLNGTKPLDGFDLWNTIRYGKKTPRNEILHYISQNGPLVNRTSYKAAIRIGDYKLVVGFGGQNFEANQWVFLSNIKEQPRENRDLSSAFPDKVRSMLARIERYREGMVYQSYPDHDPAANPRLHRGFWGPWQ